METKETKVLTQIIEKFISCNVDLVQAAQTICKKIIDYGFIDLERTLPFQIIPTEMFDSSGNVICKLFINMEHPMYGLFQIDFYEEKCGVSCPKIYKTDYFVGTHEDLNKWLDFLNTEMDEFYKLSNAVDKKDLIYCELVLNEILEKYNKAIEPYLLDAKNLVQKNPATAIATGNVFALVSEAKKDFSKALLHPKAWVIFKNCNDLPDPDEDFSDYIDDEATEKLQEDLALFFRAENFYAAHIYLAQRICLQGDMVIQGFSKTEDDWQEAKVDPEFGEYVLPPIDIKNFIVK